MWLLNGQQDAEGILKAVGELCSGPCIGRADWIPPFPKRLR